MIDQIAAMQMSDDHLLNVIETEPDSARILVTELGRRLDEYVGDPRLGMLDAAGLIDDKDLAKALAWEECREELQLALIEDVSESAAILEELKVNGIKSVEQLRKLFEAVTGFRVAIGEVLGNKE